MAVVKRPQHPTPRPTPSPAPSGSAELEHPPERSTIDRASVTASFQGLLLDLASQTITAHVRFTADFLELGNDEVAAILKDVLKQYPET